MADGNLVSYNGVFFPEGDPIVSISRSFIEQGGAASVAVDTISLEGTLSKCEDPLTPTSRVSDMFTGDFKILAVGGIKNYPCAKLTSMNFGGNDEFSYIPYTIELEAYADPGDFVTAHGVVDASNVWSYNEGPNGITDVTHSVSARGIRHCTDPFGKARSFCENLVGQDGIGSTNPLVADDKGASSPFFTNFKNANGILYSTTSSFNRVNATYSIEEKYRVGSPVEYTTVVTEELGKTSTAVNGSVFAAGDIAGAMDHYKELRKGYPNLENENITQDDLWGGINFSFSVGSDVEETVALDITVDVNDEAQGNLVTVRVTVAAAPNSPDVTYEGLKARVEGVDFFNEANQAYSRFIGEGGQIGEGDPRKFDIEKNPLNKVLLSSETKESPEEKSFSLSETYNNRKNKYCFGKGSNMAFTASPALPKIAEVQTISDFVFNNLGYHSMGTFSLTAQADACSSYSVGSVFDDYIEVNPLNTQATMTNDMTQEDGDGATSLTRQTVFDSKLKAVAIDGTLSTIETLLLKEE